MADPGSADGNASRVADQRYRGRDPRTAAVLRSSIDAGRGPMGDECSAVLPFRTASLHFRSPVLPGRGDWKAAGVSQIDRGRRFGSPGRGHTFNVDPSADAAAASSDVNVSGMPLRPEKTYGVPCSNNYRRNRGGRALNRQDRAKRLCYGPSLSDG